ncbi:NYN domain-containing protein [Marinitoga sp. 1155]|uniref:NYN domain-containing protein n=1 Tax=Marinitoga sp. 1155 TaxID=1428448 RepID=UPI00064125B5|nr:NYN domain-containing protein [Marinitoga sp. 1155]KLO22134.1 hypothetical protein X274_09150 [Marinitoga sp. 1155]
MRKQAILLIDGEYLKKVWNYYTNSLKENSKIKLDFKKLVEVTSRITKDDIEILRNYYYSAPPFDDGEEKYKKLKSNFDRFISSLEKINFFEVKLGRTQKINDSDGNPIFTQKGVDVQFAIDLIKWGLNNRVSVLILITGDSDFVPAINYVKDQGKHVYLLTGEDSKTYNENLINSVDLHIIMNKDFFEDIKS